MANWKTLRRSMKLPSDVKLESNGRLFPSQMKPVLMPGLGMECLHPKAAQAWDVLKLVCQMETGQQITTTPAGAYRTFDQQVRALKERMTTDGSDPGALRYPLRTRTFNGEVWYLKKGQAQVATPGTSRHGWGLAVDVCWWVQGYNGEWGTMPIQGNGLAFAWLELHAAEFGFYWNVSDEPWHLEYCSGDQVPERVDAVLRYIHVPVI